MKLGQLLFHPYFAVREGYSAQYLFMESLTQLLMASSLFDMASLNRTEFYNIHSCWVDGLISEQISMGHYWNKTSAPQRTTLEWKKHREEHIKDLSRKHLGNYYDSFSSILMLTAQRMFVLHGGVWKRARMIRLTSVWFMTSHSNLTPTPFFALDGKSPPILMGWSLASYSVTNGGYSSTF